MILGQIIYEFTVKIGTIKLARFFKPQTNLIFLQQTFLLHKREYFHQKMIYQQF